MKDIIYGNLEYCYGGIPIIRGYCTAEQIIVHSRPHEAYQRVAEQAHVEEIKEFIQSSSSIKFMPEIILAYDYTTLLQQPDAWASLSFMTPFDYLYHGPEIVSGTLQIKDAFTGVCFKRLATGSKKIHTIQIDLSKDSLKGDGVVFRRIDGNHRLLAFQEVKKNNLMIPFCIILFCSSGDSEVKDREKNEMEVFHNINSKAKSLTPIEQYRGLFNLFTVAELEQYGKGFSLTKAYLEKYKEMHFNNMTIFFADIEDIVLYCINFFLEKEIDITEDDVFTVFNSLEHTYFSEYTVIRKCQNRFALIPYAFYCYNGGKRKNAKLNAYNTWFIKNKLYNVVDFDPVSMIDVFNSIYEIRKKQIFVAMPFKAELDFVFTAICRAVEKINIENGIELLPPIRIDKQIVGFSYDIVDEILDNIQNAGLLIADLTEQNANVYYEAGFAQGLLKAKHGNTAEILYLISNPRKPDDPFKDVKFDLQHYKIIAYKNQGNGVNELQENIEKELKRFYCI